MKKTWLDGKEGLNHVLLIIFLTWTVQRCLSKILSKEIGSSVKTITNHDHSFIHVDVFEQWCEWMSVVQLDEEDLDEEDLAILREVAQKGGDGSHENLKTMKFHRVVWTGKRGNIFASEC